MINKQTKTIFNSFKKFKKLFLKKAGGGVERNSKLFIFRVVNGGVAKVSEGIIFLFYLEVVKIRCFKVKGG